MTWQFRALTYIQDTSSFHPQSFVTYTSEGEFILYLSVYGTRTYVYL